MPALHGMIMAACAHHKRSHSPVFASQHMSRSLISPAAPQVFAGCDGDLDTALQRFEEQRHPEVLALHDLDLIAGTW